MEDKQRIESTYYEGTPTPHHDYLWHAQAGDGRRAGKQGRNGYRIDPAPQQYRGHVYSCAKCGKYVHGAERVRRWRSECY